jgi:hypothetical protein
MLSTIGFIYEEVASNFIIDIFTYGFYAQS